MVLKRQEEAGRWYNLSVYAFWLRHPRALEGDPSYRPAGLEVESDRVRRLGQELHVLEWDLVEGLNEFELAYQDLYRNYLALKKFAIVYHTDNFYIRVHKLLENAYGLLGLAVGLAPEKRDPTRRQRVRETLDPHKQRVLREFEQNRWIRARLKRGISGISLSISIEKSRGHLTEPIGGGRCSEPRIEFANLKAVRTRSAKSSGA